MSSVRKEGKLERAWKGVWMVLRPLCRDFVKKIRARTSVADSACADLYPSQAHQSAIEC